VAVPPDRDLQPVRQFRTFTADLQRLADWLAQCRIKTVAMESTLSAHSVSQMVSFAPSN
jgi:transposase